MKRKAALIIIIFIYLPIAISAYTMEEFKKLSPSDQVSIWIETYKNDKDCFSRLNYAKTIYYFEQEDNISIFKPLLISALNSSNITKIRDIPRDFDMVVQLLYQERYFLSLTVEEKKLISELIDTKLFNYLKINKVIDAEVLLDYMIYTKFKNNLTSFPDIADPRDLLRLYNNKGLIDIFIDWNDIENHYHLSRKKNSLSTLKTISD